MNDPAFLAQLEAVRSRARREGKTITKLDWKHGHLSAVLERKRPDPLPDRLI